MRTTLEGIRRKKTIFFWLFTVIEVIIGFLAILHAYTEGKIGIEIGDAIVGLATVWLGHATYTLSFVEREESLVDRKHTEVEAQRERKRIRLKEKLDGLYSPLIGIGKKDFITQPHHNYKKPKPGEGTRDEPYVHKKMVEFRSKYKILASKDLVRLLDDYYKIKWDNIKQIGDKDWSEIIEPIWEQITEDYEDIYKQYMGVLGETT